MTPDALLVLLKTSGLEVAYRTWVSPPALPYLVFRFTYDSDLVADDQNYVEIPNYQVELYSENKDVTSEQAVETVLKAAKIPYEKREEYIEAESMTQVIYLVRPI